MSYGAGWFGEGFTDYCALALMLRAGVISLEEYARLWNGELTAYAASPARNFSNAALSENEWDDFDSSRMPYMRGAILAAMWDRQLRDLSGGAASLDDVVHDMRRRTSELPPGSALNPAYGLRELFATVARDHGLDVTTDLQAYVDRGETVQLAPGAFGPCFRVELAGEAGGLPQKLILVPDVPQGPAACGLD